MAITAVDGQAGTYTVEPNDEFSMKPTGGAIYTDAALTLQGKLVASDPWQAVNSGGAPVTLAVGINIIEAGSMPAICRLVGAATIIRVQGLLH